MFYFYNSAQTSFCQLAFSPSELFSCSAELITTAYHRFLVFLLITKIGNFPLMSVWVLPVEGLNETLRSTVLHWF